MTTNRITLASLAARMDAQDARMAATEADLLALTGIVTRLATNPQAFVPAPVAEVVAPSTPKARKGVHTAASFAAGETLAANGVSPDAILVPAGKLGQAGTQTLTQARAKREARTITRESYLAGKARLAAEGEATNARLRERKAARQSVVVIDREGTPVSVAAPKATKVDALAKAPIAYSGAELRDLASNASSKAVRNAAKAEIARRAAKRASKTA